MIEVLIFTGVFVFYYAIEYCIEYFIFGNAKGTFASSIQTEQRKLLEASEILKEVTIKAVFPSTHQQQHNQTTTTQYKQEQVYNTVSDNRSLVVYNPSVELSSFFPLAYLGFLVGVFVILFLISKWFDETERKQNKTGSSDTDVEQDDNATLKVCVESCAESSDEWFDACQECIVTEDEVFEEWFDACQECIVTEEEVYDEEWFHACQECHNVTGDDVDFEEWFDARQECSSVTEAGVFMVSDESPSADESEGVAIAFADFSLEETKDFMDMTTIFLLPLPEKKNENPARKREKQSKKDKKHLVRDEPGLVLAFDMDDTSDETVLDTVLFGNFSLEETETLKETKTAETAASNQEENLKTEKKVEEKRDENEELVKEANINTFKTDLQISSQSRNKTPSDRELQRWEPVEDDEAAELECLEKDDENLKDQTILSPEKMYKLNPDVKSTFLEDLSQYTTKLDMSTLSREQIEFAEEMANEIMKENKQRKNKQRRKNSKRNHKHY